MSVGGAIVVFAKCPIPGASKTRLSPLLGDDGAASLAQAMLSDVLVTLSECQLLKNTLKILMYAPGTKAAETQMISILKSLKLTHDLPDSNSIEDSERWLLLPMISSSKNVSVGTQQSSDANKSDLTSSSLGDKLIDALERVRTLLSKHKEIYQQNESVLFLGMDSPEIPIEEIIYGLQISQRGKAHLCPAYDGGYGLLSVPINAPICVFLGVRWSNQLTAVSQLKALTDAGVDVSIGKLMFDIDEPDDVQRLADRLLLKGQPDDEGQQNDVLIKCAVGIDASLTESTSSDNSCRFTLQTLTDLGVIK